MRVALAALFGLCALAGAALGVQGQPAPAGAAQAPADEQVRLEIRGRLESGLVAIGGETTGIVVKAKGLSWELDTGLDEALRRKADGLSGQVVIVKGTLEPRAGVELRRQRLIVRVTSLEKAPQ
jgi:hypothetical protein